MPESLIERFPGDISRRHFLRLALSAVPAALAPEFLSAASGGRRPDIDLRLIGSQLTFLRRSAWTRFKPSPNRVRPAGAYRRITVHHAGMTPSYNVATTSVARELSRILAAHSQIGYGDIGYHFIVDYAGRVWEGRALRHEGAHVSGENENNIGVVLLGNFEKQKPSRSQLITVNRLVRLLGAHYGISPKRFYGHRDLGPTVCPGRHLYAHMWSLKRTA
jgi:hypothetical protein